MRACTGLIWLRTEPVARFYERGDEPLVKLFHYRPGQTLRVRGH